VKEYQSRVRMTAARGLVLRDRASDSSSDSSLSGPNMHRALKRLTRVRIEARDERFSTTRPSRNFRPQRDGDRGPTTIGKWAMEKARRGKVQKQDFPSSLGNPATTAGFPLSHSPGYGYWPKERSQQKNKQKTTGAT